MFDATSENFDELERIAAAEPGVAGVEIDADGILVTERIENAGHAVHGVGEDAVRFQQKLDAEGFRPTDRFVEFLADAEEALLVGEVMAEVRLRIAFGGDHLFHAEEVGELDGFDDLRCAVAIG